MTTIVQAPPQAPAPAPDPAPAERPLSRKWLLGFWAAVFVAFLAKSPGKMTFETKLGVATDPWKFLADLGELWHDRAGFGGIADQYIGYAFPMLPYYALTDLLQIPTWLAERLWMSLVIAAAFWGALRLAERLGFGGRGSRALAAASYALWPTFTIVVGSTSAAALPGALLPWVLLPLTSTTLTPRVAAARSALLIPFMGGVNAASTLASLMPIGLYLLTRTGRRRKALLAWWIPGVLLATLWWVGPLLLLGGYGEDFMPYVEQADTTTGTMAATELLRGAGNWTAYLNFGEPWLPAGWAVAAGALTILGGAVAAALGLAGLARRDLPERRWLMLTVLCVVGITLAGYAGSLGGPLSGPVQDLLNGTLKPFRNIYKFQPGLALALCLGLAHLLAVLGRSSVRVRGARWLPAVAALLVIPGLALPYVNGDILQPGAFKKLPEHWKQTANWLEDEAPHTRAYVTPATAHGQYTWGKPIDQPLDVLAKSPWAQRDYVPFGTPGSRRATDAVEQALMSGGQVPGLAPFLERAGLHHVVVRNDLDPDQIGYVPPQTVKRTLELSGYKKVKSFGPTLTGGRIPANTPVEIAGFYPRQKAVDIYVPTSSAYAKKPRNVELQPASELTQVSGGPESLLRLASDPGFRGRPTVLTGDEHPGVDKPAVQANADGLRRADTRFGLVNNNTSYTYGPKERNHPDSVQNAGEEPKQILPAEGVDHQTTSRLRGAKSVTSSSSGNWLFHMPQYEPVGAFDGNPDTAWAEGSAGKPVGQWIRVAFTKPTEIPRSLLVTPLPGSGTRAAPTSVRLETDRGSAESNLRTDGSVQRIKAPQGRASWLKLTITGAQTPRSGLSGAGFKEISLPDTLVTRVLRLPEDSAKSQASRELVSLHRAGDPGGLSPVSAEVGLHRSFHTTGSGEYRVKGQAIPVPGPELDELLDEVAPGSRDRITATADSTETTGLSLSPRNLVDGDLSSAWIAGDKPTIHLKWPEKKEIDKLVLAASGGVSTRPTEVRLSSPDGATTTAVDENGWVRFDPMETDQLDITITKTKTMTVHNPVAGSDMQLPVGLKEVYLPALDEFRVKAPSPDLEFDLPCGKGPAVSVDGTLHSTKVSGKVRDLTERRAVDVELCAGEARNGTLELDSGRHTVEAGDRGPLTFTDISLSRGQLATPTASRSAEATDWSGDDRTVEVGNGEASYLVTHQNYNKGWKATLDGKELKSVRMDGWQQGFFVPEGSSGTVKLEYQPTIWYQLSLIVGLLGLVALGALALFRRNNGTPLGEGERPTPAPGWVLGALALTLVVALVSGPYALVVPVLALVAWAFPRVLGPIALAGMVGAGVLAAFGARDGITEDAGAFGTAAQALALLALAAALVTVPTRKRPEEPPTEPLPYGPPPEEFHRRPSAGPVVSATPPLGTRTPTAPPPGAPADEDRGTKRLPQRRSGRHKPPDGKGTS
ncbi:alpha-(1-_3)-arabinofuranosyltransferase family protein [Streptomyces sp. NPDC005438]|uniref:alpha-(1->3)-arabinofuranosyltransferase domain-containing protein n=1 Tax=Streptomyces sp. NPDC005438 TaxID=3156880 RepID=UPI0033B683C2